MSDSTYSFLMRAQLAQVAANRANPARNEVASTFAVKIKKALPLSLLNDEYVESAEKMGIVYTVIAAFENSARKFIQDRLLEDFGADWWDKAVQKKVRDSAEGRKKKEEQHRYHKSRGDSLIFYTDMADLPKIISENFEQSFSAYLPSPEWAKQIFTSIYQSRNVIMHAGELSMDDIQRVGINIRDWLQQVGE